MNPRHQSTSLTTVTAAILGVEPGKNGRALVTFRTAISPANPSGRDTAHTPLLSTPEGSALADKLRVRVSQHQVRRRNTTLDLGFEADGDNPPMRVIARVR